MTPRLTSTLLRTQTDHRLAVLAAQGSDAAFEALIERYRKPLHAYCWRLTLDRTTSEDVVQQAFVATWQALRSGKDIADVRAWLYRVVHNGAINTLRRSGYRHAELSEVLRGDGAPDEDVERRFAVRGALAGVAKLPELQRKALLQTAVEGRSHVAVAHDLGVTETAVRGLVYRARATLRAAATALVPFPVAELVAGGGGGAAVLLKGGATVATIGALAGGAVVGEHVPERAILPAAPAPQADARVPRADAAGPPSASLPLPVAAASAPRHGTEPRPVSHVPPRRPSPAGAEDTRTARVVAGPDPDGGGRSGRRVHDPVEAGDGDRHGRSGRSGRHGGGPDDDEHDADADADDDGRGRGRSGDSSSDGPGGGSTRDGADVSSAGPGSGEEQTATATATAEPLPAPGEPQDPSPGAGTGSTAGGSPDGDAEETTTVAAAAGSTAPPGETLDGRTDGSGTESAG